MLVYQRVVDEKSLLLPTPQKRSKCSIQRSEWRTHLMPWKSLKTIIGVIIYNILRATWIKDTFPVLPPKGTCQGLRKSQDHYPVIEPHTDWYTFGPINSGEQTSRLISHEVSSKIHQNSRCLPSLPKSSPGSHRDGLVALPQDPANVLTLHRNGDLRVTVRSPSRDARTPSRHDEFQDIKDDQRWSKMIKDDQRWSKYLTKSTKSCFIIVLLFYYSLLKFIVDYNRY